MTSKIKVDNINKVSDDSNIIKKCGTTTTIGSGASNPIVVDGSAVTIGRCGGTVSLASGATQSGFGRSGSVNWQTTPKTSTFTATSGEGYFVNSGSALTMNLPAGSAGAIVAVSDYARNFETYNLTVSPNGSEKIGGFAQDATLTVNGQAATFVYVDATKGWINVQNAEDTETGVLPYIEATGGTITTSGNDKIHTFTGPGTFTVCKIATSCAAVNNLVSFLVVAGGGGGAHGQPCRYTAGGGGAGGVREVISPGSPYTGSPLNGYPTPGNRITVTATGYPITVGAGGSAAPPSTPGTGGAGNTSTFSTISSAGGGNGGNTACNGVAGGSGGGGSGAGNGGGGNTPPVTPPQGNSGGQGCGTWSPGKNGGGGGGGAGGTGGNAPSAPTGGPGGAGVETNIPGSPLKVGGGGQGSTATTISPTAPYSDYGGGVAVSAGGTNKGGGGGGGTLGGGPGNGGAGGSGVVVIRYRYQ